MAWPAVVAGEFPRFLADRGSDDGVDFSSCGSVDGVGDELQRGLAAGSGGTLGVEAEDGEFVVIEHDDVMGVGGGIGAAWSPPTVESGVTVVLVAPPEGFDFRGVRDIGHQFVEAEDDVAGEGADVGISEGLDDNFGADAGGIAHGDADDGASIVWLRGAHACPGRE